MKKQILLFEAIYDSFQKYSQNIHTYYEIYGIINYEYKAIIGAVIVNNNQSNIFIMLFTDENMNEPETHDIVLHFTKTIQHTKQTAISRSLFLTKPDPYSKHLTAKAVWPFRLYSLCQCSKYI